ncbi:DUF4826 family protein [Shewanella corallii]|uniref:DUF4826 family protein n=1 Tax=Shewanella corallii TaxID=560080 RepID=A0ABT0N8B9_9GAMM|nr:DUF4826 family protein [Shewanella corallii]MCL2914709.1 DUF4826 family protein [Shewanella corallii]
MTEQTVPPTSEAPQLTPEQAAQMQQEWVREQFQKANKFLAEKGVIPGKVLTDQSRYLVPYVAVWKMESSQPKKKQFWVISGDLPTDYVPADVAPSAREAIKHFSLTWQLKAENLIQSGAVKDPTQAKFANMLVSRAQSLYKMQQDEKLWGEQQA